MQQDHNGKNNGRKFRALYLDTRFKKMQRESEKPRSEEKWDLPAEGNAPPAKAKQGTKQDAE